MLKKIVDDGMIEYAIPGYFWPVSMAKLTRMLGALARHEATRLEWFQEKNGGTQFKMALEFEDGGQAIVKFMRLPREIDEDENRYVFDVIERHVAEIASFQLDKVLGFYRMPPTIGRKFNITSELLPHVEKDFRKTFYRSPAGNLCFFGTCEPRHYCNTAHPFCGSPDVIEASVMAFFPDRKYADRISLKQPWKRSYQRNRKADWELNDFKCISVKKTPPYNNGKLLLDLIDVHTFDFLTGNKDRHNIAMFREWGNYTFPLSYDNGRGFGRQDYDALSILAPLRQCCHIRHSTFLKYLKLYLGPETLSSIMEQALADDPVAPVLLPGHLRALDRRLVTILRTVANCIEKNGVSVIVKDKF
ncbi:FA20C-like protein [Mya arenaria]|uniref:FA20C-like protein n=1 Tax=Mya arenaria TaxID=6604 RepID=A0ABY7FEV4_MYAAR|nr:FA20C-like protein [Mya arenaria]